MPKRCPKCKTLNSGSALRCANPNCNHQFSPDSPVISPPPPAAAPAAVPQPVADPQPQIASRDPEVMELLAVIDRLHKEVAAQQQMLQHFVTEHRAPLPSGPSQDSTVKTPARMAAALGLLARWPKVTAMVTAVMTLGAGYGGWSTFRDPVSDPVKKDRVEKSSPAGATSSPAGATTPLAIDQGRRSTALDNREATINRRESQLNARDAGLKARETDVAVKEKSLKARTIEITAQGRSAVPAEVRVGYFDFQLLKGRGTVTLYRADVRGAWPSRECAIVAVTPLDRDELPASFASSCTSNGIVLDRPKGVPDGQRVRVVWQLNETPKT